MTRILNADENSIEIGAKLIKDGKLVVFPTETVYGLGANCFDEEAVESIFKAKGRPQDNPLIVHISDIEQVKELSCEIPKEFYSLADKFMPGALTVILKKSEKVPYVVTAGGETVGIRMPNNAWARKLIEKSFPLAAPSANRSKHISPTTAQHVYDDLNGEVDLILDGGSSDVGIESTVLDLTTDVPTILRPGAVTADMLVDIVGSVSQNGKVIKIAKAPGMKYTHYAPKVETVVAKSIDTAITQYDILSKQGHNPVLIVRDIYRDKIMERNLISLGITASDYARNIYSALRKAENDFDFIIIENLTGDGIEASVMNRVNKSAGGKFIWK